ncbi:MAG: plasmid mobilization protein, partial [Terracidiphilus sp.]
MQQSTATPISSNSADFAGLLAALAAPALNPESSSERSQPAGRKPAPAWNDDDLDDDVLSLSYERALRTHARYRPPSGDDLPAAESSDSPLSRPKKSPQNAPAISTHTADLPAAGQDSGAGPEPSAGTESKTGRLPAAHPDRDVKDASITIRMSKGEYAQLHCRAAEAGMTVSAYLRSCTFEAESLREMVKET